MEKMLKQDDNKREKVYGVYIPSFITRKVFLSINDIGKNIKQNLERSISADVEGRWIVEGYVKPKSINITSYSSGKVNGNLVEYHATFECMICNPVEGMVVYAIVKTITKAGIHAKVIDDEDNEPITVFIARDHHINNTLFDEVKENAKIKVTIIGNRFELNDTTICTIGYIKE